ncbi:hypothetical protein JCM30760_10660 [Thiomicrorhabdus hydrogeniphila]
MIKSKENNVTKKMKQGLILTALLLTNSLAVYAADSSTVKIGALVAGQVTKMYVTEGQTVKVGDRLLNLDGSRYQAKTNMLVSKRNATKLELDDSKIELDQAKDLYDRTVTSKRALDASQLRYDIAMANYQAAKAALAMHKAWAKYVYIKSPINGKVVKIMAPVGTTVYKENTPMLELEAQ